MNVCYDLQARTPHRLVKKRGDLSWFIILTCPFGVFSTLWVSLSLICGVKKMHHFLIGILRNPICHPLVHIGVTIHHSIGRMPILIILALSTQSFAAATSQDMSDDDDLPAHLYPEAGAEQCALLLVAVVQLPT